MDNNTSNCLICGEKIWTDKWFSYHLRSHKITKADYYQKYYPRHDFLTGELIPFKDKDFYFSHDFINKDNMSAWMRSQPKDKVREYARRLLLHRKERKSLVYAPSEVELRTVMSPSVRFYEQLFGDYYELCNELGFKNKYKKVGVFPCLGHDVPSVICDTREQKPLKFDQFEIAKLDFGDYKLSGSLGEVYFERKALLDFVGTMVSGFDRFSREVERALKSEKHLVVMVESSLTDAQRFHQYSPFGNRVQASAEFVFSRARDLIQTFPNLQFLFVRGREEMIAKMIRVYRSGQDYKEIDLELCQSKGLL